MAIAAAADLVLDTALVKKYDGFGPRYTSYPTADRFHAGFTAERYVDALRAQPGRPPASAFAVRAPARSATRSATTARAIRSSRGITGAVGQVHQVSWVARSRSSAASSMAGAGRAAALGRRNADVPRAATKCGADGDAARRTSRSRRTPRSRSRSIRARSAADTIAFLGALGFNRISIGIQDFDPAVQQAVNRIQTEAETLPRDRRRARERLRLGQRRPDLRAAAADGDGFYTTLDQVIAARPTASRSTATRTCRTCSSRNGGSTSRSCQARDEAAILALAIETLDAAGYLYIGMDHFAKPGRRARGRAGEGKLHRNFQGYSTMPDCDMLAFGISAIGKVGATYVANVKSLDEYYAAARRRRAPGDARHRVRCRRPAAPRCDPEARCATSSSTSPRSGRTYGIAFADYFAPDLASLAPLAADGLLVLTERDLEVTMRGRLLVRTVAMHFDRYLREAQQKAQYSRVI